MRIPYPKTAANRRIDLTFCARNPVLTPHGEPLGQVSELVANPEEGRIEYVTLEILAPYYDCDLTVAVPWSQFQLSSDGEHLELDISRSVLEWVASPSRPRH